MENEGDENRMIAPDHEKRVAALVKIACESGADNAAIVPVSDIQFRREFRAACEQNLCGKFGRCWTCPPDVGDIDELIAKAKKYQYTLVFQTIGELEDSYDIEGMEDASRKHNAILLKIEGEIAPALSDFLTLGAGGCQICERCAKMDEEPCRDPQKAIASLEAHGIAVSDLAEAGGMKYINGQNTVTYFGGFMF